MNASIVFFDFTNRGLGGIERLIITLTEEFSKTREVKLIALKSGVVYKLLIERNVKFTFLDFSKKDYKNSITHEDLLITFNPSIHLIELREQNPMILIWRVFPSFIFAKFISKIIFYYIFKTLDKKKSLIFMDDSCWSTASKELKYKFTKYIIPIPIQKRHINKEYNFLVNNEIKITYIGRGKEIWKIKPVKKIINDISKIPNIQFLFFIFTDTNELFERELSPIPKNVKIKYIYKCFDENLSKELILNSNLHFSMGTSALEGGLLGIPTIIADQSYDDFPDNYKYRWLKNDFQNYAGLFINKNTITYGYSISEVLEQISGRENAVNIG